MSAFTVFCIGLSKVFASEFQKPLARKGIGGIRSKALAFFGFSRPNEPAPHITFQRGGRACITSTPIPAQTKRSLQFENHS